MIEKLMTVKEVADKLSVSQNTVYRMAERRELPSVKIGKAVRFKPKDLRILLCEV